MPDSRLEEVRQQLSDELDQREAESQQLKAQLDAVEADRKAIAAALAALGRKRGAATKPSARKTQVVAILRELLEANGPIEKADLKALVGERLTAAGKSLSGFGLRFGEAMKDPQFESMPSGRIALAGTDADDLANGL